MQRRAFMQVGGALTALAAFGVAGAAHAATKPGATDALLVIDVQNCFIPGGSLAVKEGDAIVPVINKLAKAFANVVITQDWHTADHVSFASQHQGKKPFETVKLKYGTQVLWPEHCVQGTGSVRLRRTVASLIAREQAQATPGKAGGRVASEISQQIN